MVYCFKEYFILQLRVEVSFFVQSPGIEYRDEVGVSLDEAQKVLLQKKPIKPFLERYTTARFSTTYNKIYFISKTYKKIRKQYAMVHRKSLNILLFSC
jgi:hypothetical protein